MKSLLLIVFVACTPCLFSQSPDIEWQKNYGGSYDDIGHAIGTATSGDFIITGDSKSSNGDITGHHGAITTSDYWIVNTNEDGIINWQKSYGGTLNDVGTQILQTADGGFITCGYAESTNGNVTENIGWFDYWIIKMNSAGIIEWKNNLGGTGGDFAFDIDQTSDLGYIISGYTYSSDGDVTDYDFAGDYWVVKLDVSGNLIWEKTYGGSSYDYGISIIESMEGGYLMTGYSISTDGDISDNHGNYDTWIIKIDELGELEWERSYGGSNYEFNASVIQNGDGDYLICSSSISNDGDVSGNHAPDTFHDYWVFKINQSGDIIWQKCYGGTYGDYCQNALETPDKGYLLIGYSASSDGDVTGHHGILYGNDYWLVKINALGELEWEKSLGGSLNDSGLDIALTEDGGIIVAGSSESTDGDITANNGNYDYWIVKLQCAGNLFYADTDEDGFGDIDNFTEACFAPSGYIGDSSDCNDSDPLINPAQLEICNVIDDNCNGFIDDGIIYLNYFEDTDMDGFGDPLTAILACNPITGMVTNGLDCNDDDAAINPDVLELCNYMDDNCNLLIDEGVVLITFYADVDEDGFGDLLNDSLSCFIPDGYLLNSMDCNDADDNINPDAVESCNLIDDDCNSFIDDGLLFTVFFADADGDNFGNALVDSLACSFPDGFVLDDSDCDDSEFLINPDALEICNALDDNCNVEIDETLFFDIYYIDADGDNYGDPLIDSSWCSILIGYVADDTDCNDEDPLINPGMEEILNGLDDNCNQLIDEGLVSIEESTDQSNFTIFPNPNNGTFYISVLSAPLRSLREANQSCVLEIFNSLGQIIFTQQINTSNGNINETISIQNPSSGVYFIIIYSGNNSLSQNIIIQ